jgi:hypothetical protein
VVLRLQGKTCGILFQFFSKKRTHQRPFFFKSDPCENTPLPAGSGMPKAPISDNSTDLLGGIWYNRLKLLFKLFDIVLY